MENKAVKILAIDDNKDNLTILKALIMEAFPKAIVLTAFTGQKGLEIAEKEEPDVILLDIIMSGLDGYETCRKLKADKKLCDIPVVFASAIKSDKTSRIKALESGADAFLTQPIDESELTAQIRAMLKIRASTILKRNDNIRLGKISQENVNRFQSLFDHMSSGVAIYKVLNNGSTGKDYIVLDFNKAALQMEGKKKNDVLGKSLYDLRPNIDEYGLIPAFQKAWQTGEPVFFPAKVYIDEKYTSWYENRIFKLPSGEIIAIYDDVTDKMLTQKNLQESQAKYRQIADNVTDVVWTADMEMRTTYISPSVEKMLGESPEAHMRKTVEEKLAPDSLRSMHEFFLEELEKEKDLKSDKNRSRIIEVEHYRADGSVIWVSMHASFLRDENGKVIGFQGVSRDVTENKLVQEKIAEQNSLLEKLPEQVPGVIYQYRYHPDGRNYFPYASSAIWDIYEVTPEEVKEDASKVLSRLHPDDYNDVMEGILESSRTLEIWKDEYRVILPKKGERWVSGISKPEKLEDGSVLWHGYISDITERKQIEEALRKSEDRFRVAQEISPDGFIILHPVRNETGEIIDFTFVYENQAIARLTQTDPQKVIGKRLLALFPAYSGTSIFEAYIHVANTGETQILDEINVEEVFSRSKWLRMVVISMDEEITILAQDITERKQTENELTRLAEVLEQYRKNLEKRLLQSVNAISRIGELRDAYTAGHQKRVAALACTIGSKMGFTDERINNLSFGALIHDIGKIFISSDILNKPGKVSALEYQILQTHVEESYNVVKEIDFPEEIHAMIHQHHERLDGSGYPQGLSGDEIILESRIIAVADVVEAMSSHRPYRAALGIDVALEEILLHRGTKFDTEVVDICIQLIKEEGYTLQSS